MTPLNNDPTAEVGDFLARYAATLLGCGATCIRITRNVGRMAAVYGYSAELTVLPAHVELTLYDSSSHRSQTMASRVKGGAIDFARNAALSRLSWRVADEHLSLADAEAKYSEILERKRTAPTEVLLLASLANAAFCRLFGGDWAAMAVVFVATLVGFSIKQMVIASGRDDRLAFIAAAFVSATLAAACEVFGLGATPEIAVGTSVLYLIPGVPYINVVSDLLDRHYLCAFSRFANAFILTVCLSLGLCAGMFILGIDWF